MDAFPGFSHVYHPDGLNTTSPSQGYIFGAASGSWKGEQDAHSKDREGLRSLPLPESSLQVNRQSCRLNELPQQTLGIP